MFTNLSSRPLRPTAKKPDEARNKIVALLGMCPRGAVRKADPAGVGRVGQRGNAHRQLMVIVARSPERGRLTLAYVTIPNDLSRIKTKVAFNLTGRQLICFGGAALVGVPSFLLARNAIGNTGAMF